MRIMPFGPKENSVAAHGTHRISGSACAAPAVAGTRQAHDGPVQKAWPWPQLQGDLSSDDAGRQRLNCFPGCLSLQKAILPPSQAML